MAKKITKDPTEKIVANGAAPEKLPSDKEEQSIGSYKEAQKTYTAKAEVNDGGGLYTLKIIETEDRKMELQLEAKFTSPISQANGKINHKTIIPFSRTWSRSSFLKSIEALANDVSPSTDEKALAIRAHAKEIKIIMDQGSNKANFLEAERLVKNKSSTLLNVKTTLARAASQGVGRIGKLFGGEGRPSRKDVESLLGRIKSEKMTSTYKTQATILATTTAGTKRASSAPTILKIPLAPPTMPKAAATIPRPTGKPPAPPTMPKAAATIPHPKGKPPAPPTMPRAAKITSPTGKPTPPLVAKKKTVSAGLAKPPVAAKLATPPVKRQGVTGGLAGAAAAAAAAVKSAEKPTVTPKTFNLGSKK